MYSNKWPLRQDDAEWRDEIMWNREIVIETHMEGNCASREEAKDLLREFDKGNTIEHEGCLLTSLSMVLQLLGRKKWTPELLNKEAHECLYYTPAGLSMVPLYADIVSEVSKGEIQLCAKEEYLPGEDGWEPNFPSTSWLVRAYRELPESDRCNFVVMLKTGTYENGTSL